MPLQDTQLIDFQCLEIHIDFFRRTTHNPEEINKNIVLTITTQFKGVRAPSADPSIPQLSEELN